MNSNSFVSANDIRIQFTQAMSKMYQLEVPLYKKLLSIAENVNQKVLEDAPSSTITESHLLKLERHGAIRVGSTEELSTIRRLFAVMGMYPVDYYDLSVAGIPVHSTAFRALDVDDLNKSPFRVFCSLLRFDQIDDQALCLEAKKLLSNREIFPIQLLKLIEISEKQGGLVSTQVSSLLKKRLKFFGGTRMQRLTKVPTRP